MFLALDKDTNGTLSKQELKEYADGTLTEIFIERGTLLNFTITTLVTNSISSYLPHSSIPYMLLFNILMFKVCSVFYY